MKKLTISRRLLFVIIGAVVSCVGIVWVVGVHGKRFVKTNNAYVNANIVQVAPQVSGQVWRLYVKNNQVVKAQELLFELDPEPYQVAVAKAKAQLAMAQAVWYNAHANTKRTIALVKKKALSVQDQDEATKNLQVAIANFQLAQAQVQQALLELRNTRIYAVTNGVVTNMTLRAGNMVDAHKPLFALISHDQFWVDANFKETELRRIRVGQTAKIIVDMYPTEVWRGVVESISGGSGAAFSLLPPQNATGNWIKITQRVPVKISFLHPEARYPLRVGVTATVTIDSKSKL